jgi:hypothetical protein
MLSLHVDLNSTFIAFVIIVFFVKLSLEIGLFFQFHHGCYFYVCEFNLSSITHPLTMRSVVKYAIITR